MTIKQLTTNSFSNASVTSAKLANTGVTAAVYGNATFIPTLTISADGRITSAANTLLSAVATTLNILTASGSTTSVSLANGSLPVLTATGTTVSVTVS